MNGRASFRSASALAVVFACAATVTACGSSGGGGTGSGSKTPGFTAGLKYADCMRQNGVPDFPDPMSGGGFQLNSSLNPKSPSFQTAAKACVKLQPGGAGGPGSMTKSQLHAALKFAACMRQNGVHNFPDPAGGGAAPNSTTPTLVLRGMEFQSTGGLDLQAPQVQRALTACGVPPPPAGSKPRFN